MMNDSAINIQKQKFLQIDKPGFSRVIKRQTSA